MNLENIMLNHRALCSDFYLDTLIGPGPPSLTAFPDQVSFLGAESLTFLFFSELLCYQTPTVEVPEAS